jgi:hypothetical protein
MTTLKTRPTEPETTPAAKADFIDSLEKVEMEAVIGGALMRLHFIRGVDPFKLLADLKGIDPTVQVRDSFPMKGQFGGNRETKTAAVVVISIKANASGAFVDLTCQNGEDLTVRVSKKKAPEIPGMLAALGRLTPDHLAKVQRTYDEKTDKPVAVILSEAERFGAKYWTSDDGANFLEEFTPEPPPPTEPKA